MVRYWGMDKVQADNIISQSRCAMCNRGVHIDPSHGRITCDGCNQFTDYCLCDVVRAPGQMR